MSESGKCLNPEKLNIRPFTFSSASRLEQQEKKVKGNKEMKQPSSSQHTMPKSSEETEHLLPKVEHLVPQLTETRVVDVADAFYQLEPHPDPSSVLEVSSVDSAALCPFTTYTPPSLEPK